MRKKIAIALRNFASVGGTTTTIIEHSRRLILMGWEVHLFTEHIGVSPATIPGIIVHRIPQPFIGRTLKSFYFAKALKWLIKDKGFDLIHGHGDLLDQDILSLHNCIHATHEFLYSRPCLDKGTAKIHRLQVQQRRFKMLIANSQIMKKDLVDRYGIGSDAIEVIYPGYDPFKFFPSNGNEDHSFVHDLWQIPKNRIVIGHVTSGDHHKRGVDLFLKSISLMKPQNRAKIIAVIVGKKSQLEPYMKRARAMGIADHLRWALPTNQVETYLRGLNIFFYPALFEEFGQVFQEAMACGLPILSTHRVGASELLKGEATEYLSKTPDPEFYSKKLNRLTEDRDLRNRLGRTSAESCANNTWDENFKKTAHLYNSAVHAAGSIRNEPPLEWNGEFREK